MLSWAYALWCLRWVSTQAAEVRDMAGRWSGGWVVSGKLAGGGGYNHHQSFQPTDLLGELLASEEEAQQAANDDGQHRQDEQSVLFADILHPPPHFIQSHRHPPPPPPPPPACPGPDCNFVTPLRENPRASPPAFYHLFSHIEPKAATTPEEVSCWHSKWGGIDGCGLMQIKVGLKERN